MLLSKQMLPIGDICRPVSPKPTRPVADCVQRGECTTNPLFAKFIIGQLNTLPVSATPFEQFSSIGNLTHLHRQAPRVEWVCVLSPLPSHILRRQPGLVSHLDAVFAPHAGRKSLHPRQPTLQSRESSQELCRDAIWNHPRWWRRRRMRGKGQKPTNSSRHGFKLLISESFWSREDRPYPAIFTPRYGDARFPPRGHGATALMARIADALASLQRTSSEVPDQCQLPQGRGLCRGPLLHDIGGVAGTSHRRA